MNLELMNLKGFLYKVNSCQINRKTQQSIFKLAANKTRVGSHLTHK